MRITRLNRIIAIGLGALLLGGVASAYAATSVINAQGTMAHHEPFDGPATMTARSLFIEANEVLPWHQHPGIGAYTIVKTGTLTVEDGCGGEVVYPQGTAFIVPPGRLHRGIACDAPVESVHTFMVTSC
jgi:quercetin dioxygenase-like cupin family protein